MQRLIACYCFSGTTDGQMESRLTWLRHYCTVSYNLVQFATWYQHWSHDAALALAENKSSKMRSLLVGLLQAFVLINSETSQETEVISDRQLGQLLVLLILRKSWRRMIHSTQLTVHADQSVETPEIIACGSGIVKEWNIRTRRFITG